MFALVYARYLLISNYPMVKCTQLNPARADCDQERLRGNENGRPGTAQIKTFTFSANSPRRHSLATITPAADALITLLFA